MAAIDEAPTSTLALRAGEVLDALKGMRRLSDQQIAARAGLTRSTVQGRRTGGGSGRFDLDDVEVLARALNVAPHVFLLDPVEAQRWVLDHAPHLDVPYAEGGRGLGTQSSPWTTARTESVQQLTLWTERGIDGVVLPMWPRLLPDLDEDADGEVPAPETTSDDVRPAA